MMNLLHLHVDHHDKFQLSPTQDTIPEAFYRDRGGEGKKGPGVRSGWEMQGDQSSCSWEK